MKICVIASFPKAYGPVRIMLEGKKMGQDMYLATWNEISVEIKNGGIDFLHKGKSLAAFDAIIPRSAAFSVEIDKKRHVRNAENIARLLVQWCRKNNIYHLNGKYFEQYQSMDKLAQQYFFAENNLPGIDTYFTTNKKKPLISGFKLPVIGKTAKGSRGTGVFKFQHEGEMTDFILDREKVNGTFIFQRFMFIKHDIRVLVLGGKILGAMKRYPGKDGQWKTNVSLGGKAEKLEVNKKIATIAIETAKKMKLEYVGVDLLEYAGEYYIIFVCGG